MAKLQQPLSFFQLIRHSLLLVIRNPKYSALICITFLVPLLLQLVYLSLCYPETSQILEKLIAKQEVEISPKLVILTLADFVLMAIYWIFITPLQVSIFAKLYLHPENKLPIKEAFRTVSSKIWKNMLIIYFWILLVTFVYFSTELAVLLVLFVVGRELFSLGLMLVGSLLVVISFTLGSVLLQVVLDLATVVCVLEYKTGIQALKRGVFLLNGSGYKGYGLYLLLSITSIFISPLLQSKDGNKLNLRIILVVGLISTLLGLLLSSIRVVFYFSCRAYHQEEIEHEYMRIDNSDMRNDIEAGTNPK